MGTKNTRSKTVADKLIWIGIALGMLVWVLESLIHFFAPSEGGLVAQIFPSNWHGICTRLLVAGLPVLLCTYAQFTIKGRRRIEEELSREKDRVQKYLDVAGVMLVAFDSEGVVTLINKRGCEILGYEKGEIVGKNWFENFLPERLREATRSVSKKLMSDEIKGNEYYESPVLTKQGGERIIAWRNSVLRDEQDNIIGYFCSGEDVTETRLAENEMKLMNSVLVNKNEELMKAQEELQAREAILRSIFRAAPTGIGIVTDRILGWTNSMVHEMTGYTEEELSGKSARMLYPSDADYECVGREKYAQIMERGTGSVETRWRRKDGAIIDVLLSSTPISLDDLSAGVTFTALDITDRKKAAEALRESEEKYRLLVENIPSVTWVTGEQGKTEFISPNVEKIYGYNQEEICKGGESVWFGRIHPDDIEMVRESFEMLFTKKQKFDVEYRIQRKDGEWIWLHDMAIMAYEKDNVQYAYGVFSDITDRKRMEDALRESEKRYRSFLQNFQGIAFRGNINFVPLFFHGSVEAITGYKEQEFLAGKPRWDQIIHPDDKLKIRESIEKIHSIPNYTTEREYRIICKDGKVRWVYELIQNISDDSGVPVYVQGAIYDITDRVRAEETLRESESQLRSLTTRLSEVEEDERRRLAQELHDKVGQNLTALSINLSMVRSLLPTEVMEKLRGNLDDSTRLLEETTKEIRDVMAELRPPVLDDYGLTAALHWYGEQFSKRTGIPIEVQGEELAPRLPADVEITLFRIAQEALTNTAKHAQASHVNLSVQDEPERLLLTIADNGTGFNPTAAGLQAGEAKWGLITMQERAIAMGGQFQVESGPEMGTRIVVDVRR